MKTNNCPDCKLIETTVNTYDVCQNCIRDTRPKLLNSIFVFDGSARESTSISKDDCNIVYTVDKL